MARLKTGSLRRHMSWVFLYSIVIADTVLSFRKALSLISCVCSFRRPYEPSIHVEAHFRKSVLKF